MNVRRGATIMLMSQWGRAAAQIVSLVALARLLAPSDYGLVAMTAAITGLALAVGDFGLSLAAIQTPDLSRGQRSNLFWLNAGLGLVGGGAIAAAAPLIAVFYHEPRLQPVALALALVFLVNGCSVQFLVELNRAGRFGTIGLVQLAGQVLAVAGALTMAAIGAGYWSLVGQQFISVAVILIASASTARWRPGLPSRGETVRPLLRFGGGSLASQVLAYVTSNLDSVLIGRHFSAAVLGLYNRAFTIAMLPVSQVLDPLTRVIMPRLAAATDHTAFNAQLGRVGRIVAVIIAAPMSFVIACGPAVLGAALGPQWAAGGDVLRVLSVAAVLQSANYLFYWAFMARARTGLLFLAEVPGKLVIVVTLFAVIASGPVAVAWAVTAGSAIGLLGAVVGARRIGVSAARLATASAGPVILFAIAGGCAFAAEMLLGQIDAPVVVLAVAVLAWTGAVLVGVAAVPRLRREAIAAAAPLQRRLRHLRREPQPA